MEPWLDSLSEDWKSDHHSSSPAASISSQQKRTSIGSSKSQSRIPHLAQSIRKDPSGSFLRPRSTRGIAKSRNEPVLTERSASSLNVPPPTTNLQKRPSVSTLPRRASSTFSDSLNSVQHHTVHERLNDADTPEWKRRLAKGEDVASDGLDLFAPSKLEGIFKAPIASQEKDSESSLIESFSKPWKSLDLSSAPSLNGQYQSLRASRSRPPALTVLEEVDEDALSKHDFSAISSDVVRDGSIRGIVQKRVQSLERSQRRGSSNSTPAASRPTSSGADSSDDPRARTVSGRKELEDEFISPVTASRQNTIRENAIKDSVDMDLEALDEKLVELGVRHQSRPSSSSSDRQISYGYHDATKPDPKAVDDLADITSQSLPDDLSMGTQDFITHGGFVNRRRGAPSHETSFLKRGLSSTDHSHLDSRPKQIFRSSPPPYSTSKIFSVIDRPASPLPPSTPQDESVVHHETPAAPQSAGSPLKLFGNRDTYTNNKLMRILSRFNESGNSKEEGQEVGTPEVEQNELRMSRFGKGELDKYDFNFEKQVSPVVAHLVQEPTATIFVKQANASQDQSRPGKPAVGEVLSPLRSPKRRRTLLKSGIAVDHQQLEVKVAQVQDSNRLAGTKRKDARPGDPGFQAEPDVLASRTLLRPTSSRKSSITNPSQVRGPEVEGDQDVTEALAAELASFAHEAAEMQNDSRKPSLATKDYMEEANKVMEFIRARGKPKPNLPLIEEPTDVSELDADKILDMDIDDESTKEEFSRPPSRDGPPRSPVGRRHAIHDPETANYLRKYQEEDELEILANTSGLGTLKVADNKAAEEASQVPVPEDSNAEDQESSPPNMRILNADQSQRKRKHSASTVDEHKDAAATRQLHTNSSDSSTRRTFPTSSSSGNKGMITHGTVSIPDQVGTMTFDHQRKTWVQAAELMRTSQVRQNKDRRSNTDDDPFANIPDLSFEEHLEQDLKSSKDHASLRIAAEAKSAAARKPATLSQDLPKGEVQLSQGGVEEQGRTDLSIRSEISKHESRLHDGLTSRAPSAVPEEKRHARAVTIAFSSPLVSAVKYPEEEYLSDDDFLDQEVNLPLDDSEESIIRCSPQNTKAAAPSPQQTPSKEKEQRYEQYRAMTLNRRRVSRIDEIDEDQPPNEMSLVHVKQTQQLTPAPRERSMVKARSGKHPNSSILCLTPLSEFSLHQIDHLKHPEDSFVEDRVNPKTLRQAHGSQALAVDALIKAITDAASGEIYWENLRTLRLEQKGLTSLHSLHEYCSGLEELSAVGNQISHLNGVPASLRVLDFRQNALTNLTSWTTLQNLQYLDVSGNQLESLDGFGCLVHLRRLIANGNKIKNIDGIMELNGLLELEVRGNELIDIDFEDSELVRLKKLDLGSNKIRSIRNPHLLTRLEELDVSHNQLVALAGKNEALQSLATLNAAHNHMEGFDLAEYPGVRVVNLDGNRISTVSSLQAAYGLETLSLRAQRTVSELVSSVLSTQNECRQILLSSNVVPGGCFDLPALPQHNLRELEISSCGISELPPGFGRLFPNCRTLNLNFNGLSDITPLRGMQKLTSLEIARNRFKKMRRTCLILSRLASLTRLDLRDNPLSLGFYPPQQTATPSVAGQPEMYYKCLKRCVEKDKAWIGLLDETTKLRRRAIELLLADHCLSLNEMDGADFGKTAEQTADQTWDTLTEQGVLVIPAPALPQEKDTNGAQVECSGRDAETGLSEDSMAEERSMMMMG